MLHCNAFARLLTAECKWSGARGLRGVRHTGVLWRKADERGFPVSTPAQAQLLPLPRSAEQDLAAALAGAGGGQGGGGQPST